MTYRETLIGLGVLIGIGILSFAPPSLFSEKIADAFLDLKRHFVTGIADFSVCIERSGHIGA